MTLKQSAERIGVSPQQFDFELEAPCRVCRRMGGTEEWPCGICASPRCCEIKVKIKDMEG